MARRVLASLLVVLTLAGCSSWRPVRAPLAAGLAGPEAPRSVRVRLVDGTSFDLGQPSVTADSLRGQRVIGVDYIGRSSITRTEAHAVALAEVRVIEVKHHDGAKTALVVIGSVLFVAAALAVWVGSSLGGGLTPFGAVALDPSDIPDIPVEDEPGISELREAEVD